MARPRQYQTDAERQAAYRQRRAQIAAGKRLAQVPAAPGIANMAARRRWESLIARALADLQTAAEEMHGYYDERSEEWQESERGEEFSGKLDDLEEIAANLEEFSLS